MIFFLRNKILFGDSCSGKTYFYKKIKIKKIDVDFLINYNLIYLKFEKFFRKIEKKILLIILKNKNFFLILGGGCINIQLFNNFLIFKNNSIINLKKNLNIENFNRPTLKKKSYLKIRFCLRKKFYLKIFDFFLKNCIKCNLIYL